MLLLIWWSSGAKVEMLGSGLPSITDTLNMTTIVVSASKQSMHTTRAMSSFFFLLIFLNFFHGQCLFLIFFFILLNDHLHPMTIHVRHCKCHCHRHWEAVRLGSISILHISLSSRSESS